MPNDNKLKGSGSARHNNIKHRDKAHPWHLPYLKTCIIKDYRTKPYYDGSTYFTCCLSCLRELELGPFFRNSNPRLFNAATISPVWKMVSAWLQNSKIKPSGETQTYAEVSLFYSSGKFCICSIIEH